MAKANYVSLSNNELYSDDNQHSMSVGHQSIRMSEGSVLRIATCSLDDLVQIISLE